MTGVQTCALPIYYVLLRELCDELEFRQFARRVFTDLSVNQPEQAVAWGNQTTQKKQSTQNIPDTSATPTLFDAAPSTASAPQTVATPLSSEVLASLQGKDIALIFDGPSVMLSTDADTVWSTTVGELDVPLFGRLVQDPATTKICFDIKNLKYILAELDRKSVV